MLSATEKNELLLRWDATLARSSREVALFAPSGAPFRTFAQLEQDAADFADRLADFPPGAVVAIQIGNSPHWPALLLGCVRRQLVPLPLGGYLVDSARDAVLTAAGGAVLATVEAGGLLFTAQPHAPIPRLEADFLKLTSGTTAIPRIIRFRLNRLIADCDNLSGAMGLQPGDRNFGVIPFSHSYGFSNLVMPLLCGGVPLVASDNRFPRAILNDLASSQATVFPGTPVFFQTLAELPGLPDLPALRLCISAGAPLSPKTGERFTARFGRKIHSFYGASECGGISYDASDTGDYEEGYVGQPLRNVRIEPLPGDRIAIHSNAVGEGYLPEPDPESLDGARFVPGDLARQNERGLFLTGRVSDIINVAGRKLSPAEVEAQLIRFPGVRQAVVFGIPSLLRNEEPIACVAAAGIESAALMQHARESLGEWQRPRAIWMVDKIPVDARGEISRRDLALRYLERAR